jgi:hypothetical protein
VSNLGDLWHLEPSLVTGVITALLALLVAFGLPITPEQKTAVLGIIGPVYAILAALNVRRKVVPKQTIEDAGHSPAVIVAQAEANKAAAP